MKVSLKVFKDRNYQLVALFSLTTLISFSFSNFYSGKSNRMRTIEEGMNTCFNRLNQSYTAKMLADNGSFYLDSSFAAQTEECYSDVIAYSENIMQANDEKMFGKLNTLSREAFWFNQKVSGQDKDFSKNPEGVILSSLSSRFQKLEIKNSEIIDFVIKTRSSYAQIANSILYVTYASFIVLLFQAISAYRSARNQRENNLDIESAAQAEMQGNQLSVSRAFAIVKNALAQNHLTKTSKLFERSVALLSVEGVQTKNVQQASTTPVNSQAQADIDKIWQESERDNTGISVDEVRSVESVTENFVSLDKGTYLEEIFTKCFDSLSSKIFTTGTRINIEGEEDVKVDVENEELEQALYHTLTAAMNLGSRDITITPKRHGGVAIIDITAADARIPKEFLIGHKNNYARPEAKFMDFFVVKEIVREHGKVKFENTGENSFNVQISFDAVEAKRVVDVQKTTKKQLLEKIKSFRA